ncbi:hypothetical protein VTL71DRAFT_3882 [Oculimacula yallundae]|uniref:Uncharacterized protein n=1 Tax=Oculimacula yallundae TaxID=86028 RepID=A0ABR4C652_9HELO
MKDTYLSINTEPKTLHSTPRTRPFLLSRQSSNIAELSHPAPFCSLLSPGARGRFRNSNQAQEQYSATIPYTWGPFRGGSILPDAIPTLLAFHPRAPGDEDKITNEHSTSTPREYSYNLPSLSGSRDKEANSIATSELYC